MVIHAFIYYHLAFTHSFLLSLGLFEIVGMHRVYARSKTEMIQTPSKGFSNKLWGDWRDPLPNEPTLSDRP